MPIPTTVVSKIVDYCKVKGYKLFTDIGELNIVYVEGMDTNGIVNKDEPNQFNDVRLVLNSDLKLAKVDENTFANWGATTEPGRYYTNKPMNPGGAARIAFGQYKAWSVGTHGNSQPHEALVQVAPVSVYRDKNKDGLRTGDRLDTGLFGINQHWGFDLPPDNVGTASAGCLVGRTREGHRQFMKLVKTDPRYQKDRNYVFWTTVIPGDELGI
ncbi:hypothetical protein [Floridanema evergladense]|uniref:Uncharacterized protein n=1 Tax=Floridaenema evergladense BLCC-F167 TaxID=3153639 RepID=A0ABV4WCV7_9CYAN